MSNKDHDQLMKNLEKELKEKYENTYLRTKRDYEGLTNDSLVKRILNGGEFVDKDVIVGPMNELYWEGCSYYISMSKVKDGTIFGLTVWPK